MRILLLLFIALTFPPIIWAGDVPDDPEQKFIYATDILKTNPPKETRDKAIALIVEAAKDKHPFAQMALCVELREDNDNLEDLMEAHAWGFVSGQVNHKFQSTALSCSREALGRILFHHGTKAVNRAKLKAQEYLELYKYVQQVAPADASHKDGGSRR